MIRPKAIISLIIIFLVFLCTSCDNSLLNEILSGGQKSPDSVIKKYLHLDENEYKYKVLDNFLFINSMDGFCVGYKTDKGVYSLVFPSGSKEISKSDSNDEFMYDININQYLNNYGIGISVGRKNKAIDNNYSYSVYDSTGVDFTTLQYQDNYSIWWIKVMGSFDDNYKLFVKMNDISYEVLNGQTINERLSK